jgi:hypothetical protein
MWMLVFASGVSLHWWFMYGPWRNAEGPDILLAHDAVRFGPVPMFLTLTWLLISLVLSLASIAWGTFEWIREKQNKQLPTRDVR